MTKSAVQKDQNIIGFVEQHIDLNLIMNCTGCLTAGCM